MKFFNIKLKFFKISIKIYFKLRNIIYSISHSTMTLLGVIPFIFLFQFDLTNFNSNDYKFMVYWKPCELARGFPYFLPTVSVCDYVCVCVCVYVCVKKVCRPNH